MFYDSFSPTFRIRRSLDFIEATSFGHIHIFTYSPREGTKAAHLPDQINNEIKKQRSHQLHNLANKTKQKFLEKNLGKTFPVLWEGHTNNIGNNEQQVFGYTPNYLRMSRTITAGESIENQILPAKSLSIREGILQA